MRTRSRGGDSAPQETTAPTPSPRQNTFLRRGPAAFEEARHHQEEIEKRRTQGGNVLRFYVKAGEECEIVILDQSLDKGPVAFYEHNLQDAQGKWGIHEPCVKDFGKCEHCAAGSNSYYVMMLSVLVLKPFIVNKGKPNEQEIQRSKMLLPVKLGQFDLFRRLETAAVKEAGTMRGMYLVMNRSKTDNKASRIGEPIILDNGKMFDMLDEKTLKADYGHAEVRGQDKKTVVRPADFDITPYNYEVLFPMPEVAKGGDPNPGSVDEALREFDESANQQEETGTSRTRRRPAAEEAPAKESPPARGSRRTGRNVFEE